MTEARTGDPLITANSCNLATQSSQLRCHEVYRVGRLVEWMLSTSFTLNHRWPPLGCGRRHHCGSAMEPRLDAGAPDEGELFTPNGVRHTPTAGSHSVWMDHALSCVVFPLRLFCHLLTMLRLMYTLRVHTLMLASLTKTCSPSEPCLMEPRRPCS